MEIWFKYTENGTEHLFLSDPLLTDYIAELAAEKMRDVLTISHVWVVEL